MTLRKGKIAPTLNELLKDPKIPIIQSRDIEIIEVLS